MNKLTLYKGKAMACLLLLFLVLINGCKKELLLPKNIEDPSTDKIRTISYAQFINAVNLNSTGSLKEALSGQKAKLMNTQALDGNLNLEMDSVKKLTLGDTISYVIAIKPQTPRATTFQNLTIQIIKTKTTAFLSTYYPEKEWIDNWRQNRKTTFKGTITFNKIYLDDAESNSSALKTSSLEKKEGVLKDKMLASINGKTGLGNVISLMPGECEIYDVVTVVQQQCKFGHWNRGECDYLTIHPNWEPTSDDWPPSTTINISTVVNCAMPNFPSDGGGGGGAGSTTPNTPGTYNPCDGNPQPVGPGGISFENGTRLMVGAPTNCDELPGLPVTTTTLTPQQYLVNNLDLSVAEYNFVNNPLNGVVVAELSKYLINNGKSVENTGFVHWGLGYLNDRPNLNPQDFVRDFLTKDVGLDTSDLGTNGSGQDMNYSIYFDETDGSFKPISKSDANYNNVINNGTTSLPTNFAPCTTQALRQMGKDKGWDVGVSPLEFNRRVGQAFQEAVYKLYNQKLIPPQRLRVKYQPQNNVSLWRRDRLGNTGQVIPDWTYDVTFMGVSVPLSQHWFYDAKAVTGALYLSSSKWQIAGYLDVLSKKQVPNAPPPALVFVTPINTIISPSIIAAANSKGVQIRQAFVIIINNKLYLLQSIELTPTNDKFTNIPTNMLKLLSGPVDLEYPTNPNNGPDYEEVQ